MCQFFIRQFKLQSFFLQIFPTLANFEQSPNPSQISYLTNNSFLCLVDLLGFIYLGMYGSIEGGLEVATNFYDSWKEEVIKSVPEDQLLVFNVKQGWKPLCDFLDLPTPAKPFPHFNDSQYFKQLIKRIRVSAFFMVYVAPVGLSVAGYYFRNSIFSFLQGLLIF